MPMSRSDRLREKSRVNHAVWCLRTHAHLIICKFLIAERASDKNCFPLEKNLKIAANDVYLQAAKAAENQSLSPTVSYARPQKFTFGVHGRPRLEQTAERMRSSAVTWRFRNRISSRFRLWWHFSVNSTRFRLIFDYRYSWHPVAFSFVNFLRRKFRFRLTSFQTCPPGLLLSLSSSSAASRSIWNAFLSVDWRDWSFKWRIDGFFLFKANNWWSIGCCDWSYCGVISYRARREQENILMRAIKKEIERQFPIKSLSSLDWRKQIDWIISPSTLVVVAWTLRRIVIEAVGNFWEKSFKLWSWLKRETLSWSGISVLRAWAPRVWNSLRSYFFFW